MHKGANGRLDPMPHVEKSVVLIYQSTLGEVQSQSRLFILPVRRSVFISRAPSYVLVCMRLGVCVGGGCYKHQGGGGEELPIRHELQARRALNWFSSTFPPPHTFIPLHIYYHHHHHPLVVPFYHNAFPTKGTEIRSPMAGIESQTAMTFSLHQRDVLYTARNEEIREYLTVIRHIF